MGEARFEIFEDAAGEYRFRVRASNGEIVGPASQGYRDATDARRGIEALVRAVDDARSAPNDLRLRVVEVET